MTIRSGLVAIVAIFASLTGVLVGRSIAYARSVGDLGGIIEATFSTALLVLAVVGLTLTGLIAIKIRHGRLDRAIKATLAAAALLAIGATGGDLTAGALGGTHRSPVVLTAPAELHLRLANGTVPFTAQDRGQAECRSEPDGRSMANMAALDLGELGPGTMRAGLTLTGGPADAAASAEFFIDGGDLPEGSAQVSWDGRVNVTTMSSDGTSGQVTFTGLTLLTESGKPAPGPSAPTRATDWPSTLSGTLSWTCKPW